MSAGVHPWELCIWWHFHPVPVFHKYTHINMVTISKEVRDGAQLTAAVSTGLPITKGGPHCSAALAQRWPLHTR